MDIKKMMGNSKEVLKFWKDGARGWAPSNASNKLEEARIDWLIDLTDCLNIWITKTFVMSDGELILAYANLGALVEGWLKLFYCVYYNDYISKPKTRWSGDMIEPNDLKFEYLIQFSRKVLWTTNDDLDKWIKKIQHRRNAIHSFNDREIGTSIEYAEDLETFGDFIQLIDDRLPYPDGSALLTYY